MQSFKVRNSYAVYMIHQTIVRIFVAVVNFPNNRGKNRVVEIQLRTESIQAIDRSVNRFLIFCSCRVGLIRHYGFFVFVFICRRIWRSCWGAWWQLICRTEAIDVSCKSFTQKIQSMLKKIHKQLFCWSTVFNSHRSQKNTHFNVIGLQLTSHNV